MSHNGRMIDSMAADSSGTGVRANSVLQSIIDTEANRKANARRGLQQVAQASGHRAGDPFPMQPRRQADSRRVRPVVGA
jgi:NAD(P)-dependent dehydrogenase (short-subunit alcohol dehydrogenase family)